MGNEKNVIIGILLTIIIGVIIYAFGIDEGYNLGTSQVINYVDHNLTIDYIKELVKR